MSIPDNFLSKNCIYLFSKHIGQHLFSLFTLFNVPIDEVCQKFGKNAWNLWKLETFEIFVISGVNLRHFQSEHCNYLFIKD